MAYAPSRPSGLSTSARSASADSTRTGTTINDFCLYRDFFVKPEIVFLRSQSKKKAFTKASQKWKDDLGKKEIEKDLSQIKKYCQVFILALKTIFSIFEFP